MKCLIFSFHFFDSCVHSCGTRCRESSIYYEDEVDNYAVEIAVRTGDIEFRIGALVDNFAVTIPIFS